jgi:hypothetical protein
MNQAEIVLWKKIKNFEIDDLQADFSFSDRLAAENRWRTAFTLRVIEEYKKFMFLICVADHALSPSEVIDEAWHLHLLYTRSYWKDFCERTLGREIHHGPTKGGKGETQKFHNWYALTLKLYEEKFGHTPPADIWPAKNASASRIQKIDTRKYWIIKKPY